MDRSPRRHVLDHLRFFFILLVVFDHSLHMYSGWFSWFWFIQPKSAILAYPWNERPPVKLYDVLHLLNYLVMIPGLFLIAGVCTPIAMEVHGRSRYLRQRMFWLLGTMYVGGYTVSAILRYIEALHKGHSTKSFWWYWMEDYSFTPTGFWFLGVLFVFTLVYILLSANATTEEILHTVFNKQVLLLERSPNWFYWYMNGMLGLLYIGFTWFTYYGYLKEFSWIGWKWMFVTIGSFLGVYVFLYILGLSIGIQRPDRYNTILQQVADCKTIGVWAMTVVTVSLYIVSRFTWLEWTPINWGLRGMATCNLLYITIILAVRYCNQPIPGLTAISKYSFSIYILHEPIVLFLHYWTKWSDPTIYHVLFITIVSISMSVTISKMSGVLWRSL